MNVTAPSDAVKEKAHRLASTGAVTNVTVTPSQTTALVKGDHNDYTVTLSPAGAAACSCPWGCYHSPGRAYCSHVYALQIVLCKADQEMTSWIPISGSAGPMVRPTL